MVAVTTLALGLGLGFGLKHANAAEIAQPTIGTTWDYPLGFSLTASNANKTTTFYPVDLENTSAATITALKKAGHTVVCYFSAGSIEDYRKDASQFPAKAQGKTLDGWPDEKWLDTRDATVRSIMATRIKSAATKGCVGVDPDNIDGYSNDSGFPLTEANAIDYVKYLAKTAHAAGLAYGLKNSGGIVKSVVDVAEWAINEECTKYNECADWAPFVKAGKPVFHVEYTSSDSATKVSASELKKACGADGQSGFSSIVKHNTLDNWIVYC